MTPLSAEGKVDVDGCDGLLHHNALYHACQTPRPTGCAHYSCLNLQSCALTYSGLSLQVSMD